MISTLVCGGIKNTTENPELSTWLVNKGGNKICIKMQVTVNIKTTTNYLRYYIIFA